ncbi:MAG: response regulator transcription factor [Bacteroidetes bacterium]|nr:response regulator transcription factor [Bacteroidota bacterium]MBU1720806.1 response regulator transcription factor [Bacteroidota bacterium]
MDEKQKILVVEDELKVAQFIRKGLEEEGYDVEVAYDGLLGRNLSLSREYHLIILDINMPLLNGYEVCKSIRTLKPEVPVIMLTAFGDMQEKLLGFEAGVDDYLVKPFEFKELLARAKALIRRRSPAGSEKVGCILAFSDVELDLDKKEVRRNGKKIDLTAREFRLLEFFIRNKNRVISKAEIAESVWDLNFDSGTNIVEVYINFLRKKVDRDFPEKLIHTVIGMGYIFKEE